MVVPPLQTRDLSLRHIKRTQRGWWSMFKFWRGRKAQLLQKRCSVTVHWYINYSVLSMLHVTSNNVVLLTTPYNVVY